MSLDTESAMRIQMIIATRAQTAPETISKGNGGKVNVLRNNSNPAGVDDADRAYEISSQQIKRLVAISKFLF